MVMMMVMSLSTAERTRAASASESNAQPRVLKARPVKNPRSLEEIITDAEKKFPKTLAYLAR
jgi:hypothetical protein